MKRLNLETACAAILLIALGVLIAATSGCCTSVPQRAEAASKTLEAWTGYRAATVPHPDYTPQDALEVDCKNKDKCALTPENRLCLGHELEANLELLAGEE